MKIALAFIAGAAATAPVISLDLEGAGLKAVGSTTHGTHFPRKTFTKANTAKVHVCQARNANTKKNCVFPFNYQVGHNLIFCYVQVADLLSLGRLSRSFLIC